MLLAVTVTLVASVAVAELPVKGPTKLVAVHVPSTWTLNFLSSVWFPPWWTAIATSEPVFALANIWPLVLICTLWLVSSCQVFPTVAFPLRVDTPVTLKFVAVKLVLTPVGAFKDVIVAAAIYIQVALIPSIQPVLYQTNASIGLCIGVVIMCLGLLFKMAMKWVVIMLFLTLFLSLRTKKG